LDAQVTHENNLGSRQIATLLPELVRQNKKLGVVSMCIGTGMGAAALIERE
jgi:acetyl-CoA acyltransferase 1